MEMEHINENTIRVLIGNDDLNARGIRVLDLLGNHKEIENFFYSVLEEVDTDHQFIDNDAVTFQVMPTRTGLELFISKADKNNREESTAENNDAISEYIKRELSGHDHDSVAGVKKASYEANGMDADDDDYDDNDDGTKTVVITFRRFEDLVQLANELIDDDNIASDLYSMKGHYYLALTFFDDNSVTPGTIDDQLAIVGEYAQPAKLTKDVLSEHGKLLMDHSALELTRYYFKN
ncbi:adaptor protein MecA [Limosilactobacillus difficilis]|uniref:adaptor protein MecA n=1 Tax=Limosilactobacillus difficilis TaxID=2991838 RepID=UPI0024B942CF|nr:adaptor protein MecA [Limosilactobacillus difficilis]